MPTPKRPPAALDPPTREQLDELDALMERMLALPVDPLVEPPEAGRADPAPPKRQDGEGEPPHPGTAPTHITEGVSPPAMPATRPDVAEGATTASVARVEVVRRPFARRPPDTRAGGPAPASATGALPLSAWLRPFRSVTQAFDAVTSWLGPPGRWLRGPRGRGLLGWTGVLLLAAAIAWVLWDAVDWSW
jgi:hypothetical protein